MHVATCLVAFTLIEPGLAIDDDTPLLLPDEPCSGAIGGSLSQPIVPDVTVELQDTIGAIERTTSCAVAFGAGFRAWRFLGKCGVDSSDIEPGRHCHATRTAGKIHVLPTVTLGTTGPACVCLVLVRRTRAAFPACCSVAVVCYPVAWDAQWLVQALNLPRKHLKLVLRAWLLITIDAKGAAAAIRGSQLATAVALQNRIVVHQPWNQDSR